MKTKHQKEGRTRVTILYLLSYESPRHVNKYWHLNYNKALLHIKGQYQKCHFYQFATFRHFMKMQKSSKYTKVKSEKSLKLIKKHQKKGGVNFGLKTGSRGTPWNRKNAGPGGSDFTKCRFWSFK